jgi:hypothetical protein
MKGRVSRATQRPYPLTMICHIYRVPRSSVYAGARPTPAPGPAPKPGPRTRHSDAEIVERSARSWPRARSTAKGIAKSARDSRSAGCTSGASASCA